MRVRNPLPQFDIHTTRAQLQIKSPKLELKVDREPARMQVHRTRPRMKVNWAKVRAQSGLRGLSAERQHRAQIYRQKALAGISRTVNEYDQISAGFQNYAKGGPEIVATVSLNSVMQQDITVVDVASMPSSSPEVEWEPGSIEIEWVPATLEMHWEGEVRPEVSVTPHTVEIRLINGETIRVGEDEARAIERQGYGKRLDKKI